MCAVERGIISTAVGGGGWGVGGTIMVTRLPVGHGWADNVSTSREVEDYRYCTVHVHLFSNLLYVVERYQ